MLQIASSLERIQAADGHPLPNVDPADLLAPRIGFALTLVLGIWSFLDRRGSCLFASALVLMVLAVLGYGVGVYFWLWPVAAILGH